MLAMNFDALLCEEPEELSDCTIYTNKFESAILFNNTLFEHRIELTTMHECNRA